MSASNAAALDWTRLDLAGAGRTLIEASAGTGKTWTISVLYLRLLLERGLGPRQIVVTTFTNPAAQELRERLRERLVWAEARAEAWRGGTGIAPDAAPDERWLQSRWLGDAAQAGRDRLRLRLAQIELDLAPIGTIHGLCQRILSDYPFESGSSFQPGEMVSSEALLDEWSQDLWRRLQQGESPPGPAAPASLPALRRLLKAYLQPGVSLWTPDQAELAQLLPPEQADVLQAFTDDGRHFLPRKTALRNALLALADWLRARGGMLKASTLAHLAGGDAAEQLRPEVLAAPATVELLAFAARAARVLDYVAEAERVRAWQGWLDQVRDWRERRLAARGQLTFDELIARVGAALARQDGVLAARLHAAWPVALVDEFQDTDAQQYAILRAIYSEASGAPRGRLVMIGDPKQAIYRFRGGDVATYLRAAAGADQVLRLELNHRSSRALVAAINQFYAAAGPVLSARPDGRIRYESVRASSRRDDEVYTVDGVPLAQPLQLHLKTGYPASVPARAREALEACSSQIAGLLQSGDHRIGGDRVQPGDIAVLLPGNHDIVALRALLQRHGVPCVGAGRSSVFGLEVARELQIVLYGIDHAGDEGALRAALATRLYGMRYGELKSLRDQPEAWLAYEQQFQQWRLRWQRDGVLAVVRLLVERAAPALLAGGDGERMLTDLRHLGELLQAQSEQLHGSEQLLAWLAQQRSGEAVDGEAADEQQLRIESDAHRVRLMTLHASKGLEFPIVFLPLMWDHVRNALDVTAVIDEPLCGRRVVGFGAAARLQYDFEGQDERFRVLYVALTRAIHACHVYVLPPDRPADARSDKPLRDPLRAPLDVSVERLLAAGVDLAEAAPQLAWLADEWPWREGRVFMDVQTSIARRIMPMPAAHPDARVYSFSTLARGAHDGTLEDQPASDEAVAQTLPADALEAVLSVPAASAPAHPELLALAAVRGADVGNAIHAMFERRVVGVPMAEQTGLIDRCLREFGVRLAEDERSAVVMRLARRLQANLDAVLLPGLSLGSLPPARQLAEMEFHYVLDDTSMAALRKACARLGEPELVPFTAVQRLRGRMTGKIDLIVEHEGRYLVIDYKSNDLGGRLDGYMSSSLGAAMDAHQYRFQALLYTLAVDRMLRQRMPGYRRERHLGEAVYLFVRAVGLAPQAGVWRHRFEDRLIDAVDAALAGAAA